MSENLMKASRQWSSRPSDERFWGLKDLFAHLGGLPDSIEVSKRWDELHVVESNGDLRLSSARGSLEFTNWSFGQLCSTTSAPRDFVADGCKDNAKLACDILNQALANKAKDRAANARDKDTKASANGEKCKLLYQGTPVDGYTLRAAYSTGYARVPDISIIAALMEHADGWRVPPARPHDETDPRNRPATAEDVLSNVGSGGGMAVRIGDKIGPSGIYRGDRSMFAFMVDEDNCIDDGNGGSLHHGIIVQNSEVGYKPISIQEFLFQGVCGNHIIWGVSEVTLNKRKHRGKAASEWLPMLLEALDKYRGADLNEASERIEMARKQMIGPTKDDVLNTLGNDKQLALSGKVLETAFVLADKFSDSYAASPRSIWGMVNGITRASQVAHVGFADQRAKLDAAAGYLMGMVTAA